MLLELVAAHILVIAGVLVGSLVEAMRPSIDHETKSHCAQRRVLTLSVLLIVVLAMTIALAITPIILRAFGRS